jgi:hypothetical protein
MFCDSFKEHFWEVTGSIFRLAEIKSFAEDKTGHRGIIPMKGAHDGITLHVSGPVETLEHHACMRTHSFNINL